MASARVIGVRRQWSGITRSPEFESFYFGTNNVPTQTDLQKALTKLSTQYDIANIAPDGNDGILITFRSTQPGGGELRRYGNGLSASEMEVIGNTWRFWWD